MARLEVHTLLLDRQHAIRKRYSCETLILHARIQEVLPEGGPILTMLFMMREERKRGSK